jgi:c-di-AMP phosphodiesterase-like protein
VVDVSDQLIDVAGKFVTYALYPESAYSILLSRSKSKCKISIGYNPWSPVPRRHNIAAICERYGGGGHPVVGAISLLADKLEEAKALVRSIAEELAA